MSLLSALLGLKRRGRQLLGCLCLLAHRCRRSSLVTAGGGFDRCCRFFKVGVVLVLADRGLRSCTLLDYRLPCRGFGPDVFDHLLGLSRLLDLLLVQHERLLPRLDLLESVLCSWFLCHNFSHGLNRAVLAILLLGASRYINHWV